MISIGKIKAEAITPDRIYLSVASKHVNLIPESGTKYNEINPGFILSWDNRKFGLNYWLGGVKNSFSTISPYLAVAKIWPVNQDIKLGLVGSIAGYYGNGSISSKIGNSGYVFLGGMQFEYKKLFIQLQPTLINNNNFGGVFIAGFSIPIR